MIEDLLGLEENEKPVKIFDFKKYFLEASPIKRCCIYIEIRRNEKWKRELNIAENIIRNIKKK